MAAAARFERNHIRLAWAFILEYREVN